MTESELYKNVIGHLNLTEIHPLHKAIIEECCENALANKENINELQTLIFAVQVSFLTWSPIVSISRSFAIAIAS